jgi:hypothetical protein
VPWLISQYPNYGISNIGEYLRLWLGFVHNAPQEGGLIENINSMGREHPQYVQFVSAYALFLMFLLIYTLRRSEIRSQQFIISSGLIILAILEIVVLLGIRSAGSTDFEAFSLITSLTMMVVGFVAADDKILNRIKWGFIVLCIVITIVNINLILLFNYDGTRIQDSRFLSNLHQYALSYNRPIIVVVPDNSFIEGLGLEELLLKGFSDFPTWNITTGKILMNKFVPNLTYRSNYITQNPEMPYPTDVVIMWFDKISSGESTNLRETYPELNKVLSTRGTSCTKWLMKSYEDRTINICAVP